MHPRPILALLLLILLPTIAQARLHETIQQIIHRYGDPIDRNDSLRQLAFHKADLLIVARFDQHDHCDYIAFSRVDKAPITATQLDILLTANLGENTKPLDSSSLLHTAWVNPSGDILVHDTVEERILIRTQARYRADIKAIEDTERKQLKDF